ncbi:SipW-dependent-type signal peptide-containing protein [Glaciihabitans sp. dw_435]|uniref:SipW-dependent-type signal peptide-containing protein n=1 Tax=Glaciihabitans sp. dw_435 TaxID=2720081 RepID=UPI001BD63E41|nr:SipW-dependent-type signal peptide-containing protein [Glaciihabitans sp. dw_435]
MSLHRAAPRTQSISARAGAATSALRSIPRSVVVAVSSAAIGALLLGGAGTYARWTDAATGSAVAFQTGTLTATVSAPTVANEAMAAAPAGVVVRSGSSGMIPGIQLEKITYTVNNTGTARARAKVSVDITATVSDVPAWNSIQPYLTATITVGASAAVPVPAANITATGLTGTIATPGIVEPGGSTAVVIRFSLPGTSGSVDLTRTLQSTRSASVAIGGLLAFAPVMVLVQTPMATP